MPKEIELHPLILDEKTVLSNNIEDYPDGIIIAIDKPYRWTSADVIRKVKYAAIRHFGKKNLKVGHAGTLDPLATGVLLVCIGKATKLAETLQAHDKEYIAEVVFGATTPSYDLEKEIDRYFPYGHITEVAVRNALTGFLGEQDQIAPLFSAKSVDGVRAYELARQLFREKGTSANFDSEAEGMIRTARINITDIELLSFGKQEKRDDISVPLEAPETEIDKENAKSQAHVPARKDASSRINVTNNSHLNLPSATVRIECSKGTYIRAIARDLGEALGSGAHLGALCRSRSGDFPVTSAITVEQVISILQ